MKHFTCGFVLLLVASLAGCCCPKETSAPPEPLRIIDTHIHLYDTERAAGVDWPPPGEKVLYRPVLPAHFNAIAEANELAGTVIVEASERVEDNQWILDLVKDQPERYLALVGSLPVGSVEFAPALEHYKKDPRYVGIRLRSRGVKGEAFFTPEVWRDLQLLSDAGLRLDLLMAHFDVNDAVTMAQRLPELKILINHLAGEVVTGDAVNAEWVSAIKRAAAEPNIYMKISGIFQQSKQSPSPKSAAFYAPVLHVLYEAFGENRIIYGSNWPVSDRGGAYEEQLAIVKACFAPKGPRVMQKLFAENAEAFYGLEQAEK
jgi:predicted TIM-barrel fold metal-dependent hydrolase